MGGRAKSGLCSAVVRPRHLVPLVLAALAVLAGCRQTVPEGAELTRPQCADLVRRVQRLESEDTGGMRLALTRALRSGIDGCLEKGTERAYRCVLQAERRVDLEPCERHFKP